MAVEKKTCIQCGLTKPEKNFFKTANPFVADERLSVCNDCVHEMVNEDNLNEVIEFLRLINRPYLEDVWETAYKSEKRTIGEYMRVINSLKVYRDLTYADSSNLGSGNDSDIVNANATEIQTEAGETIHFSPKLVAKWGPGFKDYEYLSMEKFYLDMVATNEIKTTVQKDAVKSLSMMAVIKEGYLRDNDINNHEKLSRTYDNTLKTAGLRPIDKRNADEERGIRTFSQIFAEVEKRGFKVPPPAEQEDRYHDEKYYSKDIIDKMITNILNYYQTTFGAELLSATPEDMMEELDGFFEGEVDESLEEELLKNSKNIPDEEDEEED